MSSRIMSRRLIMTQRLYFACIALALASTGMSCNQNAEDVPPVQTGGAEAVDVDPNNGDSYEVVFETTAGNFTVEVHPDWSPNGAARFKELIDIGYYDNCRFFRVVPGFMVQWGMNGDPKLNSQWSDNNIQDDPVIESNTRGYMTFAKTGAPDSRSTQLFINYGDNSQLDGQGFSPFAIVTEGMDVVDKINPEYREQPNQGTIAQAGNAYLKSNFPKLDYILKASYKDGGAEQTVNEEVEKGSGKAADSGSSEESGEGEPGTEGETSECGVNFDEFHVECDDQEKVIGDPVPGAKPTAEEKTDEDSQKPFDVKFETTKGDFILEVHPEWAPVGAARFKELVEKKYYDECRFFRVLPGFVVQWGMNGDPKVNTEWSEKNIKDDPVNASNKKGFVTFAKSGRPNSRTTQLYINLGDNERLDDLGFAPFAKVKKGMNVVEKINAEYRQDPDQGRIAAAGNEYLKENFPRLDSIRKARVVNPVENGKKVDAKKESKAAE